MGIENVIAQFGKRPTGNAGAGIGYGIQMRNQRQREREYEDRKNMLLEARQIEAQRAADAAERAYAERGVGAILSMPQEQWQSGYAGLYDGAVKNGFDVTGMPTPDKFTPDVLYKLAAATGVAQPKSNTVDAPSNVREYEYFQTLSPKQQETYMKVKRNSQLLNLGDRVRVQEPAGRVTDHMKGIPPQNTPQHAGNVVSAQEQAKQEAEETKNASNSSKMLRETESSFEALAAADLDLIYGRGESLLPDVLRSQSGIDLVAQRDQYLANLRLAQVGKLAGTGPITESEQAILKQAATVLNNPDISPELAKSALIESRQIIMNAAKRNAGNQTWGIKRID